MNLSEYEEDLDKQMNGAPMYLGDSIFYVRRWGTPESMKVRKTLSQELFGPLHKMSPTDDNTLLAHWLTEYGVAGWENVFSVDGKELKYSEGNARALFTNPQMFLSLNQELFKDALNFENYLHDAIEESVEEIKKP